MITKDEHEKTYLMVGGKLVSRNKKSHLSVSFEKWWTIKSWERIHDALDQVKRTI